MSKKSAHWSEGYTVYSNDFGDDIESHATYRILMKIMTFQNYFNKDTEERVYKKFSARYVSKICNVSVSTAVEGLKTLCDKEYIKKTKEGDRENPAEYQILGVRLSNRGCSVIEQGVFDSRTRELNIKRIKNKEKREGKNESNASNNADEKIQSDDCLSFDKINNQDENAKQIIKKWDEQGVLPSVKYNQMIFMSLCEFISNQEKRGIYTSDLLKCVENYAKTISHPKTWRKSKLTIQAFFGLNRAKPSFDAFIDEMFDINDNLKEREESEEERLRSVMLRAGMTREQIDAEIAHGYKTGLLK